MRLTVRPTGADQGIDLEVRRRNALVHNLRTGHVRQRKIKQSTFIKVDLQTCDMFNILQWNAQGISTSKEDLLKIISEQQPNVAIQETFLGGDVAVKISGYNSYGKQVAVTAMLADVASIIF